MKANPSGPEGLALQGASAALRGLVVESTTAGAARLASAPLQSQRGSRGILRQAPSCSRPFSRSLEALENSLHAVNARDVTTGIMISASLTLRQPQAATGIGIARASAAQMDDRGQFLLVFKRRE